MGDEGSPGVLARITEKVVSAANTAEWALETAKPFVHYGFIPLIIFLGMRTEPRPSIWQLLSPA